MNKTEMSRLTISVPLWLKEKARIKADYEGRTLSDIACAAYVEYVERDEVSKRLDALESQVKAPTGSRK